MNAINRAVTSLFDLVLTPLEAVSDEFALLFVSGVFGVLAAFVLASMVVGFVFLKPLGVQI